MKIVEHLLRSHSEYATTSGKASLKCKSTHICIHFTAP